MQFLILLVTAVYAAPTRGINAPLSEAQLRELACTPSDGCSPSSDGIVDPWSQIIPDEGLSPSTTRRVGKIRRPVEAPWTADQSVMSALSSSPSWSDLSTVIRAKKRLSLDSQSDSGNESEDSDSEMVKKRMKADQAKEQTDSMSGDSLGDFHDFDGSSLNYDSE
jgi:hypothetical protein